jgi:hypothetical protein
MFPAVPKIVGFFQKHPALGGAISTIPVIFRGSWNFSE